MKKYIIVNLEIEGTHHWPEAIDIQPEVAFLSYFHRHIFKITCKKMVEENDREIEFILFKRMIIKYINDKYFEVDICNFGRSSCEDIALELLNYFDLDSCIVMEDGENGAEIEK